MKTPPLRSPARRILASAVLALSLMAATSCSVGAAEDVEHYDARVQQYDPDVELKSSSTGGSWILLGLMGVICVSVIFKDARRSHLD